MSSPTLSAAPNGQPSPGFWPTVARQLESPFAAGCSIVPVYRDLCAKSDLQRGWPVARMSVLQGLQGGLKLAPTTGALIGTQMLVQRAVERALVSDSEKGNLSSKFVSSICVGALSAPVLAVFNAAPLGLTWKEALRGLTRRQAAALTLQEGAFVGGLAVAAPLSVFMKQKFGDNKAVDYAAAFTAGACGSLAGHPGNTAVTRWQSRMTVEPHQLMWGSARKAFAIGKFAMIFKFTKEMLNTGAPNLKRE